MYKKRITCFGDKMMSTSKNAIFFLIMLIITKSVDAAPSIFVGNVYDFLSSDKISFSKSITNNGDSTAFVKIAVKEVVFGKDGNIIEGEEINVNEIDERLVVSPNRLIVPAKGSRSSRVMFTGKRDIERYFRVTYVPVLPTQEDGFGTQDEIDKLDGLKVGFNMLIGYGTLVYVAPENTTYDTKFNLNENGLEVINNGNASIKFNFLVSCDKENKCSEPATAILRPGKSLFYDKKLTSSINFTLIEGLNEQTKRFKL